MVAVSYLETEFEYLIERRTIPEAAKKIEELMHYPGVLASAAAKIDLAHALGWLGPNTYSDLTYLRKIRNEFAHSATILKFDDEPIRGMCSHLKMHKLSNFAFMPRDQFFASAMFVALQLWEVIDRSERPEQGRDYPLQKVDPKLLKPKSSE